MSSDECEAESDFGPSATVDVCGLSVAVGATGGYGLWAIDVMCYSPSESVYPVFDVTTGCVCKSGSYIDVLYCPECGADFESVGWVSECSIGSSSEAAGGCVGLAMCVEYADVSLVWFLTCSCCEWSVCASGTVTLDACAEVTSCGSDTWTEVVVEGRSAALLLWCPDSVTEEDSTEEAVCAYGHDVALMCSLSAGGWAVVLIEVCALEVASCGASMMCGHAEVTNSVPALLVRSEVR